MNNSERERWSGVLEAWTEVTYYPAPVPGSNIYKWCYSKTGGNGTDGGSDEVSLDEIVVSN